MPPVAGRPGPQKQLLSAAMRQRPARYCRAPMGLSTDSAVPRCAPFPRCAAWGNWPGAFLPGEANPKRSPAGNGRSPPPSSHRSPGEPCRPACGAGYSRQQSCGLWGFPSEWHRSSQAETPPATACGDDQIFSWSKGRKSAGPDHRGPGGTPADPRCRVLAGLEAAAPAPGGRSKYGRCDWPTIPPPFPFSIR